MSDLENQARELGIKIDARWGDERLQQEIDKVLASPPKGGEKQIDIKLKVDYWPVEDQRKEAGSVVKVPLSKAKELVAQGKAEPALSNFGDDE